MTDPRVRREDPPMTSVGSRKRAVQQERDDLIQVLADNPNEWFLVGESNLWRTKWGIDKHQQCDITIYHAFNKDGKIEWDTDTRWSRTRRYARVINPLSRAPEPLPHTVDFEDDA